MIVWDQNYDREKYMYFDPARIATSFRKFTTYPTPIGDIRCSMSDGGDDDLVDDFLAAAGIGGSPSRDGSPALSPAPSKPTPKKRKNPAKSSATRTKRRKASYSNIVSNTNIPALILSLSPLKYPKMNLMTSQ